LTLVVVAGWRWYLTWLQECPWVRLQAQAWLQLWLQVRLVQQPLRLAMLFLWWAQVLGR
jgi:hypothetical protein